MMLGVGGGDVLPVADVVPAPVVLVEALHGAHVCRAVLEGQTGMAGCVGVVDVHEGERQGQVGGCSSVRLSAPHAARNHGRTV